ncbi:MAG: cardiolipin synthase [Paludibacteraceae bacterium]|nr:cardiolipin synthase [Paludibacteraceae bacterium]
MFAEITYWLFNALYIYAVAMTIIVLMLENRNPIKSIAWIITIISLPVVGLILYALFGRDFRKGNTVKKANKAYAEALKGLDEKFDQGNPVEGYENLSQLIYNLCNEKLYSNTYIKPFTDGASLYESIFADIETAKETIFAEYYIIENDKISDRFIDTLIKKANEGVKVKIVVDAVGSWKVKNKTKQRLADAGIEYHEFLPVSLPFFGRKINYRNHRKILLIDNEIGYIGGMNVADRYIEGKKSIGKWRDTHIKVIGDGIQGLAKVFRRDYHFVSRQLTSISTKKPSKVDGVTPCNMQTVFSGPDMEYRAIMQTYLRIIMQSKKYVYIESPYFMPNEAVRSALVTAAKSGVEIKIIIPLFSDDRIVLMSTYSYVKDLASAGIHFYFYKAGFIHSKLIISDDQIVSVGSANMDFRSLEHNFETNAILYGDETASIFRNIFEQDMADSESFDMKRWKSRPFSMRIKESIARLFSPVF